MREGEFKSDDLRLCSLEETYKHIEKLMRLANCGVENAALIAELAINRYFERIEDSQV